MADQYISAIVIHQAKKAADWGEQVIPQAQVVIELGETPADYKMKIGDGSTAYPDLPYIGGGFAAGSLQAVLVAGNQANGTIVLTDGTNSSIPGSGSFLLMEDMGSLSMKKNVSSAWANVVKITARNGSSPAAIELIRNPGSGSDAFYADNSGNCFVASVANRDRIGMISQNETTGQTFFYIEYNGNSAELGADNLTANRTFQFPDASGTLALAGSYSTPDLDAVLAVGSISNRSIDLLDSGGLQNCGLSGLGMAVVNSDGSQHTYVNLNLIEFRTYRTFGGSKTNQLIPSATTANRTWTLPDASGTIALTGSYTLDGVLTNGNTTAQTAKFDDGTQRVEVSPGSIKSIADANGDFISMSFGSGIVCDFTGTGGHKVGIIFNAIPPTADRTIVTPDASGTLVFAENIKSSHVGLGGSYAAGEWVASYTPSGAVGTMQSVTINPANVTTANALHSNPWYITNTGTSFSIHVIVGSDPGYTDFQINYTAVYAN